MGWKNHTKSGHINFPWSQAVWEADHRNVVVVDIIVIHLNYTTGLNVIGTPHSLTNEPLHNLLGQNPSRTVNSRVISIDMCPSIAGVLHMQEVSAPICLAFHTIVHP